MTGIQRVAIIGAGPTGVACARYLVAEKAFHTVDVFEQRNNVGGIWNLSRPTKSKRIPIPQTDPSYGSGRGRLVVGENHARSQHSCYPQDHNEQKTDLDDESLEFESPLYDYLETNIPKTVMAFSDAPFPAHLPLYPGHADVLKYLEDYAAPVRHLIRFQTQVIDLQLDEEPRATSDSSLSQHKWQIMSKDLKTSTVIQTRYDAVIIANGHYTVPHVPEIPGITAWNQKYPNTIIHSKAYRRPEDFKDKRVLVIGNSASGLDIAGQLAAHAQSPVYLASRSASQLAPTGGGPQWRKDVAEIEEFLVGGDHHRAVKAKDGQVIDKLDAIIFATGYFYSFPFVSASTSNSTETSNEGSPSRSADSTDSDTSNSVGGPSNVAMPSHLSPLAHLTTSGLRTHDVYKHFLHIDYPNLALPVLNLKIVPFPLSENQAAVVARLWSGRLNLPSKTDMRQWEADEEQRLSKAHRLRPAPNTASGKSISTTNDREGQDLTYEGGFHTLLYPEDAAQINTLYKWAASARRREGLENDGQGKLGTRWEERQVWLRGQFPNVKAAYGKKGDARTNVTSLEELGGEWKDGFEKWKASKSDAEQRDLFNKAAIPGWT